MFEVLGTVLGTAIQGQIIGGAPNCPTDLNVTNARIITKINMSIVSLEETVSILCILSFVSDNIYNCLIQHLDNRPSQCCIPVLRNKLTWLLQESSASSTFYVPQFCSWVWRRNKVWINYFKRSFHFSNARVEIEADVGTHNIYNLDQNQTQEPDCSRQH